MTDPTFVYTIETIYENPGENLIWGVMSSLDKALGELPHVIEDHYRDDGSKLSHITISKVAIDDPDDEHGTNYWRYDPDGRLIATYVDGVTWHVQNNSEPVFEYWWVVEVGENWPDNESDLRPLTKHATEASAHSWAHAYMQGKYGPYSRSTSAGQAHMYFSTGMCKVYVQPELPNGDISPHAESAYRHSLKKGN